MGNEKPVAAAPKFQIYNSETGELLGRTAGSWAKIGLFYIAYFAFLAGLFTASIQIMKTSINDEKPRLQTRLNIPGLHFFPKIDPKNSTQTDRLKENSGVPFFWDGGNEASKNFYSEIVAMEKAKYDTNAADASNGETTFDWSTLGECGTDTDGYGWATKEPCVYFRINRVIGWEPIGLFKPEEGSIFATDGPKAEMQKDAVYIRCDSVYIGDKETEEMTNSKLTFDYFGGSPNDGYIPKDGFFPYEGKKAQPNYQSPIVAVKVKGLTDGEKYRVWCQAHAKNIIIDKRDNLGHIQFEIQHAGTATKTE